MARWPGLRGRARLGDKLPFLQHHRMGLSTFCVVTIPALYVWKAKREMWRFSRLITHRPGGRSWGSAITQWAWISFLTALYVGCSKSSKNSKLGGREKAQCGRWLHTVHTGVSERQGFHYYFEKMISQPCFKEGSLFYRSVRLWTFSNT